MNPDISLEIVEPRSLAPTVADEIVATIGECLDEREECSIVLAGGSTPAAIYRLLSRPPRVSEVEWEKVLLFLGDERWVPYEDNQSNYRMVRETLVSNIKALDSNVHAVDTSLVTPKAGAAAYEKAIKEALKLKDKEIPVFDLVLLGLGKEGQIASLYPHDAALDKKGTICQVVKPPEGNGICITLSPDALFSARRILFIVTGEAKSFIVKRALEGNEQVSELPAKLYEQAADRVTWFIDSPAAQMLAQK